VGGPGDINVAVSKQDFTQIKFTFLVKVYKVLFKNVFKAFNLLKKYIAEIQPPGNGTQLLSITQSSVESSGVARHW
jgi:hypothetical protein